MKSLYILFFISLLSDPLFSQWMPQTSGITNNLRGVYFPNETVGFAVGEGFPPNESPILKTTDGGNTWVLKSSGTVNPLRDIEFVNNNKGFACGLYGTLLKTTDGGESWEEIPIGNSAGLRAIHFPSHDTGYIAGEMGLFLKTVNAGADWDTMTTGITQDLLSIQFLNNDTGYATGSIGFSNGIIIRTTNSGLTWETVYTSSQAIPALAITSDYKVFAGGGTSPSGGNEFIVRSIDGGETWDQIYTGPAGNSLRQAFFTSTIAGWFVDDAGSVIRTKDGGNTWSVNNVSSSGLNSIFFTEEDTGYATGGLGSVFKYIPCSIPLEPLDSIINGVTTICNGETAVYSISPVDGANSYSWVVPPDASIVYVQADTLIAVTFGITSGNIEVIAGADCDTSIAVLPVAVIPPLIIDSIYGNADFCSNDTGVYYISQVEAGLVYNWTVPVNASIVFQNDTMIVVALSDTSGIIQVSVSNNCDTTIATMAVNFHTLLPPVGEIAGEANVCIGGIASYSVPAVPGAVSYDWSVPPDAVIVYQQGDTFIVVEFDSSGGAIEVIVHGVCDSAQTSFSVEIAGEYSPIDTIYGEISVCEGDTISYSIAPVVGAIDYIWTVPAGATIISGQGDTLIEVSFGASSGSVGISAGTGDCNASVASTNVNVTPSLGTADEIIGVTSLCSGDTALFIVSSIPGADSYSWEIPAEAILLSGQGDTLITVIFGDSSGNVIFYATSVCETVTSTLYVTVHPGLPPFTGIVGDTALCVGDTGTYFINPIEGVVYSWAIPFDATIIATQSDTLITVLFGSTSNEVTVVAGSACEIADTSITVTVNPYPPVPVITFVDNNLISSEPVGNQWYFNGDVIAGATEQILTPAINGTYTVIVTYPPGCSTASDSFEVISVGIDVIARGTVANVIPNPFESFTILYLSDSYKLQNGKLEIMAVSGLIVNTIDHLSGNSVKISRESLPDGVYFFRLSDEKNNLITTGKLIIQ